MEATTEPREFEKPTEIYSEQIRNGKITIEKYKTGNIVIRMMKTAGFETDENGNIITQVGRDGKAYPKSKWKNFVLVSSDVEAMKKIISEFDKIKN